MNYRAFDELGFVANIEQTGGAFRVVWQFPYAPNRAFKTLATAKQYVANIRHGYTVRWHAIAD